MNYESPRQRIPELRTCENVLPTHREQIQNRQQQPSKSLKKRKLPQHLIQEFVPPHVQNSLVQQEMTDADFKLSEFADVMNEPAPINDRHRIMDSDEIKTCRESVFIKEIAQHRKKTNEQGSKKIKLTMYQKFKKLFKFFMQISNKMFSYNINGLEKEEPEKDSTNFFKNFYKLIIFFVIICLSIAIVVPIFKKIGDKKIQATSTVMKPFLDFDLITSPAEELIRFYWMIEINKQSVVDRMECLINKNPERCFEMQEQKCRSQFHVKGKDYENCMMSTYKQFDKDQTQFCQNLYFDSGTYFFTERETPQFLNDYHECLLAAGQPRGWKYCDDTFRLDEAMDTEALYECYETYNVDKMLYVEEKCLANISELEQSQEDYKNCLVENGAEKIAKRFNCDMMNKTYDLFKYRSQCFDDQRDWQAQGQQNEIVTSNDYCSTTRGLILERLQCYENIEITPVQLGCFKQEYRGQSNQYQYEWLQAACVENNLIGTTTKNISVQECSDRCNGVPECKAFNYGTYHGGELNDYNSSFPPGWCGLKSINDPTGCNGTNKNSDLYIKIYSGQEEISRELYYQREDDCVCDSSCVACAIHNGETEANDCLTCRNGGGFQYQPYGQGSTSNFSDGFCEGQPFQDYVQKKQQESLDFIAARSNFTFPEENVWSACREGRIGEYEYYYDYKCMHRCNYQDTHRFGSCQDGFEFSSEFLYTASSGNDICATICIPKEENPEQDDSQRSLKSNVDSLGHCESLLFSGDKNPSLENITNCYEHYTLAQNLPQMCGCEKNGVKFCDFDVCTSGQCHSCELLETKEDCDNLGLKSAGVRDCKLRCFNSFDRDFANDEFHCGQFNKHVVTNLTELPERERFKICHAFYPFSNEYVPIDERDKCYEQFGIEIKTSEIYDKCHDKIDDLSDYENCLVMLGSKPKTDSCWMASQTQSILDFEFSSWSKNKGLIIFDTKTFYPDCVTRYNQSLSAESCYQNFIFDEFRDDWNGGAKNCLEQFGLLISQEDKCFYDQFPALIGQNNEPVLTAAEIDCFSEDLSDSDQSQCKFCQELTKSMEFSGLVMNALRQGTPVNEVIDNLLEKNPECQSKEGIYDAYEICMSNINQTTNLNELNHNLKAKVESLGEEFTPIESDVEYCQEMFRSEQEIDSRIQCYVIIKKPLGPEQCQILQRVTDNKAYEFNLFYKYLCLHQENAILDLEASYCLDEENVGLKKFNRIDDCLKRYENSGRKPVLTQERSKFVYARAEQEQGNLEMTRERKSKFTIQQIEDYLCQNKTSLHFVTSPFKVIEDNQFYDMNKFQIELDCSIFEYFNDTRNNLMVSYTFSNTTLPRKSNPDQIGGVSLYTDDFNMSKLIVNRTDQNSQYFEIEFSEDLDLIQVQSHNVYHYEAQSGADAFELKSHEDYLELTSNPMIVKVLETYPYVISLQLMPDKILPAQSFMQIEEQVNVTKNIFGIIPFQFKDFTTNKIKFDKITEEIKPVDLNQLRSEQKNKVNKFRLSLVFDFTETIVTQSYFTTVDIFSQLGGLFASIVGILTKLGVVYLIQYNLALSQMIKRKYQHNLMLQQIKQYLKLLPEIAKIIQNQLDQSETALDLDLMQRLKKDLSCLDALKIKNFAHKYELTMERHQIFQEYLKRYMPDLLDSKALFDHQKNQSLEDEFELIEIDENEIKNELHRSRANMPLGDILQNLRDRISFFGVYNQVDKINKNKIMIKKLKYQIKLERKLREKVEQKVKLETQKREQETQKREQQEKEFRIVLGREISEREKQVSEVKEQMNEQMDSILQRFQRLERQKID